MLFPHIGGVLSLSLSTEKGIDGGKGMRAGEKELRRERLREGERGWTREKTADRQ